MPAGGTEASSAVTARALAIAAKVGKSGLIFGTARHRAAHAAADPDAATVAARLHEARDAMSVTTYADQTPSPASSNAHRALSRENFTAGALRAARWLGGRAPGLYSMRDVVG